MANWNTAAWNARLSSGCTGFADHFNVWRVVIRVVEFEVYIVKHFLGLLNYIAGFKAAILLCD